MTKEIWKPIRGYSKYYEISNLGRVRSLPRKIEMTRHGKFWAHQFRKGELLKPSLDSDGYPKVTLFVKGVAYTAAVHKLLAKTFIGPRPKGLEVCHKDGIRTHCVLSNIKYGTRKNNGEDKVTHGNSLRGRKNPTAKLTEKQVLEIRKSKILNYLLADKYGVSKVQIGRIKSKESWYWL